MDMGHVMIYFEHNALMLFVSVPSFGGLTQINV